MDLRPTFVLAEPPRPVPLSLRGRLLLGGVGQLGWLLLGFGLVFVWIFALNADVGCIRFAGTLETAPGRITRVERTRASEGGGEHSKGTPVYAHAYAFRGPDGAEREGVSYRTGRGPDVGAAVTVEFPAGRPDVSRIRGMRSAIFGPWAVFPVIFPLVGLLLVLGGLWHGSRIAALLARGHLAAATLRSRQRTSARVNNRPVFKLTFEFQDADGMLHELAARTTTPEVLEDEPQERILYDPLRPGRAALLDDLPGRPQLDELGQFRPAGARAALVAILPLLTIVGHGTYLYLRYFSGA